MTHDRVGIDERLPCRCRETVSDRASESVFLPCLSASVLVDADIDDHVLWTRYRTIVILTRIVSTDKLSEEDRLLMNRKDQEERGEMDQSNKSIFMRIASRSVVWNLLFHTIPDDSKTFVLVFDTLLRTSTGKYAIQ